MNDFLKQLFSAGLGGAIVALLMKFWLNKKMAVFNQGLRRLEKEHEVQFSRLHERIVDGMSETFWCLKKVHWAVGEYVDISGDIEGRAERRDAVTRNLREFNESYFRRTKLFLPEEIDRTLYETAKRLRDLAHAFSFNVDRPDSPGSDKWFEIWKDSREGFDDAFRLLEDGARTLLGTNKLFEST